MQDTDQCRREVFFLRVHSGGRREPWDVLYPDALFHSPSDVTRGRRREKCAYVLNIAPVVRDKIRGGHDDAQSAVVVEQLDPPLTSSFHSIVSRAAYQHEFHVHAPSSAAQKWGCAYPIRQYSLDRRITCGQTISKEIERGETSGGIVTRRLIGRSPRSVDIRLWFILYDVRTTGSVDGSSSLKMTALTGLAVVDRDDWRPAVEERIHPRKVPAEC